METLDVLFDYILNTVNKRFMIFEEMPIFFFIADQMISCSQIY